ncbi:hypothetical protein R3P38DRAFT_3347518 [Favolaschia claudopus]|uniref:Uncharacterized protein n=1 Tax=Favolaschia claudopus TaxID=2862362 RepID=A0AAW0CYJ1_9AGAR
MPKTSDNRKCTFIIPARQNPWILSSAATTVAVGRSLAKEADEYDQYFDIDQLTIAAQQEIDRIEREALGAATWNHTIHPFASTSATAPAASTSSGAQFLAQFRAKHVAALWIVGSGWWMEMHIQQLINYTTDHCQC